jgi:GNAT superfamily N-acetyltransferase
MPALRPAVAADAGAIAELWWRGWHDGHDGHVPEELVRFRSRESFLPRAQERVASTTVAEVDGRVAGFVTVIEDEAEQVYVDAGHRGSGIAAALLLEAERMIAAGGHERAWLAVVDGNARARRFYERQGWEDAGPLDYEAQTDEGTVTVPTRRYVKSL